MYKVCTVCGMGLGSSLIVELNTKKVLEELGVAERFEVSHLNLNSYSTQDKWDFIICGNDIANSIDNGQGQKIVLRNIMDTKELKLKFTELLERMKLI